MRPLRIGTRGSALALWQSRHVAARLAEIAGIETVLVEISSVGDRITDVPLSHVEGTGFFTATIEHALAAGEVDVAVHSYKDLPIDSTPGLVVAAVPARGPVEDVLCARDGLLLQTLPAGSRVGTCSTRRTAQLTLLRPDLRCVPLRGNVPTRVGRVGTDLDAIILARAGLERLGLGTAISAIFDLAQMLPAPAQGALAIQCRAGDSNIRQRLAALDHEATRRAVLAERTLLHVLEGGCSVPVAALAAVAGSRITLTAGVFGLEPPRAIRIVETGDDAAVVGESAARRLLADGAGEILAEFGKAAMLDVAAGGGVQ